MRKVIFFTYKGSCPNREEKLIKEIMSDVSIPAKDFNRYFEFKIINGVMFRPAKPLIVQAPMFKNC